MKRIRFPRLFTLVIPLMLVIMSMALSGCFGASIDTHPSTEASEANRIWTTVGSDGTVDEGDVNKVFFDHSAVQMGQILGGNGLTAVAVQQTESAVIRYNVTPVDGLFDNEAVGVTVRYVASDSSARVVAKLIEVDLMTGTETVRLNFDSKTFPDTDNYQVQGVGECTASWHFDFETKAYYVEATLTHSALIGTSAAGIQMIKVSTTCLH